MEKSLLAMPDWIADIVNNVIEKYNGRKVILWGKYSTSEYIHDILKSVYRIEIECYVDIDKKKVNREDVFPVEYIMGKSKECYVVVPIKFYQSVRDVLNAGGYRPIEDYYYFCDCIISQDDEHYEDLHGNRIFGNYKGIGIEFMCFNAYVELRDNTLFEDCTLRMQSNAKLSIAENGFFRNIDFAIGKDSICMIGRNVHVFNNRIVLHQQAEAQIGDFFTSSSGMCLDLGSFTKVLIGNDCMFSWDVEIRTSDGHSIFDVNTGKNINSTEEISRKHNIKIGNHVWIGMRSIILYNTIIEDGSIVGAESFVKGKFPNNCIIAGIPAKIIKHDVAWCRENMEEDILKCGVEYIKRTLYL